MNSLEPVEEFEALLDQLREQVSKLDSNQLPLAQAIDAYERSVELANKCHLILEEARLRIQRIDATAVSGQNESAGFTPYRFDATALLLGDDNDLMDLSDEE